MLETVTPTHDAKAAHNLIQEYFDAWKGTDERKILDWYSDDVNLRLPTGVLEGKAAVRDRFVRPFINAFSGNIHEIQRLIHEGGLVAVEWRFKAEHSGEFQGIPPSGRRTDVPGCSFYSLDGAVITAGNIYFNLPTLFEQIGASA